jgi:hypothetical protein
MKNTSMTLKQLDGFSSIALHLPQSLLGMPPGDISGNE